MIEIGHYMTIITLYKQGASQRKIAKLVGHDRKTVRRIIKRYKEEGVTKYPKSSKVSTLEGYKDLISLGINSPQLAAGLFINRIDGKRDKWSYNT
jgi:phage regulator Rha-like protein